MDVVSGYLTEYSQVNVPSFGAAVPEEEDWNAFMADVDKFLLAVDPSNSFVSLPDDDVLQVGRYR